MYEEHSHIYVFFCEPMKKETFAFSNEVMFKVM